MFFEPGPLAPLVLEEILAPAGVPDFESTVAQTLATLGGERDRLGGHAARMAGDLRAGATDGYDEPLERAAQAHSGQASDESLTVADLAAATAPIDDELARLAAELPPEGSDVEGPPVAVDPRNVFGEARWLEAGQAPTPGPGPGGEPTPAPGPTPAPAPGEPGEPGGPERPERPEREGPRQL